MKPLILAASLQLMSLGTCFAQRTYTFKIDEQSYSLEEQTLNEMFGAAFNYLVDKGVTEEKYFNLWAQSFADWKDHSQTGYWVYKTLGDRIVADGYTGPIDEVYLGWAPNHKVAKGNPNKPANLPRRISNMNYALSRIIIYHFTSKHIIN